ncbi:hypothetical protein GUJ93_ZPchr0286g2798 [Zizania palustris]|uniref:Uncharacterized protein n=1 Tax=Zizania palustris TaxID=103762 RepID=A0A8J5TKJ7_ZIZPA|nr:hypothetical protein GUJ93_ZPchr0286g2798 [Zizania palustris]
MLSPAPTQHRVFIIDDCNTLPPDTWSVLSKWISTSEGLDVDRDALKLIASRSDGSLRDAEMTLDQLSLLGAENLHVACARLIATIITDILAGHLPFTRKEFEENSSNIQPYQKMTWKNYARH